MMTRTKRSRLPHWPPSFLDAQGWLKSREIPRIALGLLTAVILTALLFVHLDFYQVDSRLAQIRPGRPIPSDVTAPRTVVWTDYRETNRQRDEAAKKVAVKYVPDENATANAGTDLDTIFTLLRSADLEETDRARLLALGVPQEVIDQAGQLPGAAWDTLRGDARAILHAVMGQPVEEGSEEEARKRVETLAAARIANTDHRKLVTAITRAVVRPTLLRDDLATEEAISKARENVAEVRKTFREGEIILRKGEVIIEEDLQQLKDQQILTPAPLTRILPMAGLMFFAVFLLGAYLRRCCRPVYENPRKLILLAGLLIVPIWGLLIFAGEHDYLVSLIVVPGAVMAIAGLLSAPVAVMAAFALSLVAGLAANADHQYGVAITTLCSALVGQLAVAAIWPASRAMQALLAMIALNLLLLASVKALTPGEGFTDFWPQIGQLAGWGAAAGLMAIIIAVGSIYMLARPFGITTHYRLMELSNPNEPLLRRMMLEAPGSYHSSVMVSNMAEAAADAIGADSLLARIAALYHDIGKLKRPAFFVENQAPLGIENVHQRLAPRLSYLILTSHVRDGAELGREYRLPEEVVSIIREHHGTTLAAYFYHRALSEDNGETVQEHDFRYPGPKPSTREAAVVMLSDSVQASVKSVKDPSPTRIEGMVDDIITARLQDGQLEDCDITLRDLRKISQVFVRMLTGLYTYTRIEYPDIKGEGTRIRANLNPETASDASDAKVSS